MIESRRLKNVVIFLQRVLSFVLLRTIISRTIINAYDDLAQGMEMSRLNIFANIENYSTKRMN